MNQHDTLPTTVIVNEIVPGEPPFLAFHMHLPGRHGSTKMYTQWLRIDDPELMRRLQAEVRPGDELSITLATEWRDDDYRSYLTGYSIPRHSRV